MYLIRVLKEVNGQREVPAGAYYLRETHRQEGGTTYADLHVTLDPQEATRFATLEDTARERDETILCAYDCVAVPAGSSEIDPLVLAMVEKALRQARTPG